MQVILSVPMPSSVFGAKISPSNSATGSEWFDFPNFLFDSFLSIVATASSLVRQSQIPSQARIMYLSLLVRLNSVISGLHVTA